MECKLDAAAISTFTTFIIIDTVTLTLLHPMAIPSLWVVVTALDLANSMPRLPSVIDIAQIVDERVLVALGYHIEAHPVKLEIRICNKSSMIECICMYIYVPTTSVSVYTIC